MRLLRMYERFKQRDVKIRKSRLADHREPEEPN